MPFAFCSEGHHAAARTPSEVSVGVRVVSKITVMKRVAAISLGLMLWLSFGHVAAAQTGWTCEGTPVEPCAKRHGRLSSQNGIAHKIWLIGTRRMVALANTSMPSIVEKYLELTSEDHSYLFGDFEICFLESDVPGHIRSACVRGAEKLVVQPLRRQEPPFRLRSTWPVGPALAAPAAATLDTAQSSRQQLSPRIRSPVPAKYEAVRDAKDWLNPYLQVCAGDVDITVRSIKRKSAVALRDLADTLVKLPAEGWPYGRVVALQECSLGVPGDTDARRQRLADVEGMLKALGLHVTRWPA